MRLLSAYDEKGQTDVSGRSDIFNKGVQRLVWRLVGEINRAASSTTPPGPTDPPPCPSPETTPVPSGEPLD